MHYYRRVRTFQERKYSEAINDEDITCRAARNRHNLPSNWDDIPIASYGVRNWKRYRKTQYK